MLTVGMFLVDRYEILAKIGAGGMADVYKAKDHILGRVVAIKVLKPEFSEDVTFVTKFRTEAQSAAGLEHPNIVNIYDVGSENGLHFIVMEHIEGITLKTYIEKKGQLSFKEATSIAIQVARGIESAHNKEITHRDIKPQNIIISTEGKVKVTDFGIARASSSQTISADVMGSVHYASPEQARNGYVDGRSDIYSLGIVMYEMVTGRVPFDGDTAVAVALQHLQEEMVMPKIYTPDLPISYEKIVLKCTQKNPDRRYQSIPELLADLRKALVTPDEDFVVIAPLAAASKTRVIGGDELERIQDGAKLVNLNKETRFAKEEDFDDHDEDLDDYDDMDDEDEEEDAGFLNPKAEKIITVICIIAFILIVAVSIYLVISLFDIFNTGKKPSGEVNRTESQQEIESDTESEKSTEDMFEMIDITGMTVEEAEEALKEWDIDVFVGATEESDEEHGIILEQNIAEGEQVEKGSTITVVVSGENSSQQKVTVPNVVTLTEEDAVDMLKKENFRVEKLYENDDEIVKGVVKSQTPEYPDKVKAGTTVTIVISLGPKEVEVPMLSEMQGESFEDVSIRLEELGFKVNAIQEYSDDYAEGIVIEVANAGTKVPSGSTLDVTVSMGKAPVITYETTFIPREHIPSDVADVVGAFTYEVEINDEFYEGKYQKITDLDTPIVYSGSDISSVKITVTWYSIITDEEGNTTGYEQVSKNVVTPKVEEIVSVQDTSTDTNSGQQDEEQQEEQQ